MIFFCISTLFHLCLYVAISLRIPQKNVDFCSIQLIFASFRRILFIFADFSYFRCFFLPIFTDFVWFLMTIRHFSSYRKFSWSITNPHTHTAPSSPRTIPRTIIQCKHSQAQLASAHNRNWNWSISNEYCNVARHCASIVRPFFICCLLSLTICQATTHSQLFPSQCHSCYPLYVYIST